MSLATSHKVNAGDGEIVSKDVGGEERGTGGCVGRRSDDATAVDVAIYNPQRRRLSRSQTNFALEANPAAPGRGCSGGCPASIQTLSSTPRPATPARPPTQHGRARERALSCRGMTECAPRSRPFRVARPRNVRPAAAPPPQPRPVGPPVQTTRPRARRVGARGTQQVSPTWCAYEKRGACAPCALRPAVRKSGPKRETIQSCALVAPVWLCKWSP